MYFSLGISSVMTELILQTVGSVYLRSILNRAVSRRYYGLLWMSTVIPSFIYTILTFTAAGRVLLDTLGNMGRAISNFKFLVAAPGWFGPMR
ncbi:hypothetical protein BCR34DRAFT_571608 [Clohesyomyces aquaticus]|uniref:Uncharacterized protein n=1 Tax=Clohesyomyces aquaticus TaxID=1231657 RepID=A0A1Y1Z6X9_9PLEO|nr:hypothetical protein BCR34DRAFT_571608 [Clohesyomyces aquaticus]